MLFRQAGIHKSELKDKETVMMLFNNIISRPLEAPLPQQVGGGKEQEGRS